MARYRRSAMELKERLRDEVARSIGRADPAAVVRLRSEFNHTDITHLRSRDPRVSWNRLFDAAEALGVRVQLVIDDERIAA